MILVFLDDSMSTSISVFSLKDFLSSKSTSRNLFPVPPHEEIRLEASPRFGYLSGGDSPSFAENQTAAIPQKLGEGRACRRRARPLPNSELEESCSVALAKRN